FLNRDSGIVVLKYHEFVQALKAAGDHAAVTFRKVEIDRGDIRGEIVTNDEVTDGDQNAPATQTITFLTRRPPLDDDKELKALLDKAAVDYQGAKEDSAAKMLFSGGLSVLLLLGLVVGGLFALRWMSGSSPLTFGRSRHKLYAQKDMAITFEDVAGIDEAV